MHVFCLVALLVATLAAQPGCAARAGHSGTVPPPSPPSPPPPPAAEDLVVLLPDDNGTVGAAVVSNQQGTTELAGALASTRVALGRAPSPGAEMSETEMRRIFGAALASLPPPSLHFTLFFRFESEELTPESRTRVPQILETVKRHSAHEVVVIGHTDTTGASDRNFTLAMSRAMTVRGILIRTGLAASLIEVVSHGEADLLVATADEVFEPRNRRVEITVR
jgi:outer membrane protein OmpA-like peptidoglycan-associated protein